MTDNPDMSRKVYLLPNELVDRIHSYQESQGISSEVETVRRLLDEALCTKETAEYMISRIRAALLRTLDIREAAQLVASYPTVSSITFSDNRFTFSLEDGQGWSIDKSGNASVIEAATNRIDEELAKVRK
jgi:hypothetical protein